MGQDEVLDSLNLALKINSPREKVHTYNELLKAHMRYSIEQSVAQGKRGLSLAEEIDYPEGIILCSSNLGAILTLQGKFYEALDYNTKATRGARKLQDTTILAAALNNLGTDNYNLGNFPEAQKAYEECLELNTLLGDTTRAIGTLNNLGSCSRDLGNLPTALDYYFQALKLAEESEQENETALPLGNIGSVYLQQKEDSTALRYFQKGLEVCEAYENNFVQITILSSFGEVYYERGEHEKAREYFEQALSQAELIGLGSQIGLLYKQLAEVSSRLGQSREARKYYERALEIQEELPSQVRLCTILESRGWFQIRQKEYLNGRETLLRALRIAESIHAAERLRSIYQGLAEASAALGEHQQAYRYHQEFFVIHDSLYSDRKSQLIAEMQEKYQAQKNEQEIGTLNLQKARAELDLAKSEKENFLLWGGLGVLILLVGILIFGLRQRTRTNREMRKLNQEIEAQRKALDEQNHRIKVINSGLEKIVEERTADLVRVNQELDAFLYEAAHALRRPITSIKGLMQLMQSEPKVSEREVHRHNTDRILNRMDNMLHKLILVNENNRRNVDIQEEIPLQSFVNQILDEVGYVKGTQIEVPSDLILKSDPFRLRAILEQLLDNALKFGRGENTKIPLVEVRTVLSEDGVLIHIRDNGKGIPAEALEKIWEMFYRGTQRSLGNGLGLYVARKMAITMGATLDLVSSDEKGTHFSLFIPQEFS